LSRARTCTKEGKECEEEEEEEREDLEQEQFLCFIRFSLKAAPPN
jgi:hypothetical protein